MAELPISQDLYDRLLTINQEAFAAKLFSAAYHALAAALHCARTLESDEPLLAVERIAREQLTWIDQHQPQYEHSSRSAAQRSHESIYTVLARQAQTTVQARQIDRLRKSGRQG